MMKKALRFFAVVLLAVLPFVASAQNNKIFREVKQLADVELNGGDAHIYVISLPEDGRDHYYLSVGRMSLGNEVVQVQVDPLSVLYIPLGDSLKDALAKLEEMKALLKKEVGSSIETPGCLCVAYPSDENPEAVTVSHYRPLLEHQLEFRIDRENYILAAFIGGSDFKSLVSSVKFYKRLHPKEN